MLFQVLMLQNISLFFVLRLVQLQCKQLGKETESLRQDRPGMAEQG